MLPIDPAVGNKAFALSGVGTNLSALLDRCTWSDEDLQCAGVDVEAVQIASIGGGLASFALIDQLRIRGMDSTDLAVVSPHTSPYETFQTYARNSQLADNDRIRSDSSARIDNPWGFPSYALEQAVKERSVGPLLRVLAEPVLVDHFRPTGLQVYQGLDREAARIAWSAMQRNGMAVAVRRRVGGGYFVAYQTNAGEQRALRCGSVHLATGHHGPELSHAAYGFRCTYEGDGRVVHVYEPHEYVYSKAAAGKFGRVLIHGAGISASQVLNRILSDHRSNESTLNVVQVTRVHIEKPQRRFSRRRPFLNRIAVQPFSSPRATFGGQYLRRMQGSNGGSQSIRELVERPTTAKRKAWSSAQSRARNEGWFEQVVGDISEIRAKDDTSLLEVEIMEEGAASPRCMTVDVVVDCTGFRHSEPQSPLLVTSCACSLCDGTGGINSTLKMTVDFAIDESRDPSNGAAIYGSGAMLADSPAGPKDSFWGVTYAAVCICEDLARRGICPRFTVGRSLSSWFRWVRGAAA